ncbi:MAG TPA: class I SAM-dependent methyltransferase [Thermoanaerobaculia bacterium]
MHDVDQIGAYYRAVLPFYDASLADRGDLPFWESVARRWGAKRSLELGCGTGRVTEVLRRAASVTGVDLLIEMLARAKRRVPEADFVVADVRTFAFSSRFDLIVLADDPMAHVVSTEERAHVIQRIAEHLAPDGRVVLEGLYRPQRRRTTKAAKFTLDESWEPAGDSTWNATYRYQEGPKITEAKSVVRSWTRDEVARFGDAALHVEHLWGDFDESPFGEESERMVIVATTSQRKQR